MDTEAPTVQGTPGLTQLQLAEAKTGEILLKGSGKGWLLEAEYGQTQERVRTGNRGRQHPAGLSLCLLPLVSVFRMSCSSPQPTWQVEDGHPTGLH